MSRLSLSDADKKARDWFASTMSSFNCTLTTDEMGSQFAIRPGKRDGPATFAGSHLDTQPTGGRYDGVLGVTAAVEMMRTLHESKVETDYPIGVVNWTNEEGARFPISMVSSGVWSGQIPLEKAHNLASVVPGEEGQTMLTELERIGYKGSVDCSYEASPIAAHFELHIEQGPTLENEEKKVGIVEGVQAYRWYTITVQGKDAHTGTTALDSRSDALLAAAKMIIAAREVAHVKGGLATVGIIEGKPGSTNTIPGNVRFSLDVRAQSDELRDSICDELMERFDYICTDGGMYASEYLSNSSEVWKAHGDELAWSSRVDSTSPAVQFHEDCIECVRQGAEDIFGADAEAKTRYIVSGAGHDSVYTSKRCPTSMIFVPSREGISHNPREFTTPEDCAIGAQVLLNAVLRYDKLRAERGG